MDYKLYTLTDEELKKLKDLIYTEELKRKKEKKEELTKALKKAWKDIEEAGLNIYFEDDSLKILFNDIYID